MRLVLLTAGVLAVILIPFFLWEAPMEGFSQWVLAHRGAWWLPPAVAVLLASDIFLPVPASIVSTASGFLFGLAGGFLVNLAGMTLGCGLGLVAGGPGARLLHSKDRERIEHLWRRYGEWTLILTRAVPVLAEAAVLFAGMTAMNRSRFFLLTALANAGVSLAYAAVGAFAMEWNSFLAAFLGSMALPAAALVIMRWKWPKF